MTVQRSTLNPAVKRWIKRKEQQLGRTCRSLWSCENRHGEKFLFGHFCHKWDKLIVTVAIYNSCVNGGWLPDLRQ